MAGIATDKAAFGPSFFVPELFWSLFAIVCNSVELTHYEALVNWQKSVFSLNNNRLQYCNLNFTMASTQRPLCLQPQPGARQPGFACEIPTVN